MQYGPKRTSLEIVENIDQMHKSTFSFWNKPDDVINVVTWHK